MNDEEVILRVRDGMAKWVGKLIRCKDCTYYQEDSHECGMEIDWFYMPDDGFCSRAEKKEEDEEIQNN